MVIEDRLDLFFSHVKYSNDCWDWVGATSKAGYGVYAIYNKETKKPNTFYAHRLSYEYFVGPLGKLCCCHHCDNRKCINPFHLFKGTHSDNLKDCVSKGRHPLASKTHCPRGHEYTEDNVHIVKKTGHRLCRTCMKIKSAINNERKRNDRR